MKKEDIKENQFVWYESGQYFGIIKNIRNANRGTPDELMYDMLMLHNGKIYSDIKENSGVTTELKVVEKIDVETALTKDKANCYTEIGKYFNQIAIINNIENALRKLPDNAR